MSQALDASVSVLVRAVSPLERRPLPQRTGVAHLAVSGAARGDTEPSVSIVVSVLYEICDRFEET
jgi:hypothetical protein